MHVLYLFSWSFPQQARCLAQEIGRAAATPKLRIAVRDIMRTMSLAEQHAEQDEVGALQLTALTNGKVAAFLVEFQFF
jgi:hypothetical protein